MADVVTGVKARGRYDLPPDAIVQNRRSSEIGVFERMRLKAFAANPEAAAEYLRRKGLEAYVVPATAMGGLLPKLQLAVRRPDAAPDTPFTVLDPDGLLDGGWRDLPEDVGDVLWDILVAGPVIGATTAGGTVAGTAAGAALGAPTGGVAAATLPFAGATAGAALGSRATELARQGIGGLFGIPNNVDPGMVAGATTGGAIGPAVGAVGQQAISAAGRVIARAAPRAVQSLEGLLAKFVTMDPRQLRTAALSPEIRSGTAPTVDVALRNLNAFLNAYTSEDLLPETAQARGILSTIGSGQVPARSILDPLVDELHRLQSIVTGKSKSGSASEDAAIARILRLIEATSLAAGSPGGKYAGALNRTIPLDRAQALKAAWQDEAYKSALSTEPTVKGLEKVFRTAYNGVREGLRQTIPDPLDRARYDALMTKATTRLDLMSKMRKQFAFKPAEGAEQIGQSGAPERQIAAYLKGGIDDPKLHELVDAFDAAFTPEITGWNSRLAKLGFAQQADMPRFSTPFGQQFGLASTRAALPGGMPSWAPSRLTVMAGLPGAALGTGVLDPALQAMGMPAGSAPALGGALGGVAALGTTRGATATTRGLERVAGAAQRVGGAAAGMGPFGAQAGAGLFGARAGQQEVQASRQRTARVAMENLSDRAAATLESIAKTLNAERAQHPEWDDAALGQEFYKRATAALDVLGEQGAIVDLQIDEEPAPTRR